VFDFFCRTTTGTGGFEVYAVRDRCHNGGHACRRPLTFSPLIHFSSAKPNNIVYFNHCTQVVLSRQLYFMAWQRRRRDSDFIRLAVFCF
jgi:hypothetical protein